MALATKHRDKPHARIYAEWMQVPAWRTLDCFARTLIVELLTRYRPTDENRIELSDRKAANMLNCSRPTAAKAIAKLVERGWLEIERIGSMKGKRCNRGSAYALTAQPARPGLRATLTFMRWQEPMNGQRQSQQRPICEPATE